MAIYQADQYYKPYIIKRNGEIVTPENVDDVAIAINDEEQRYSEGTLAFFDGKWLYHLTAEKTKKMQGVQKSQIEVVIGDNVIHSNTIGVKVGQSLSVFKEK
jgi:hypothetical protein